MTQVQADQLRRAVAALHEVKRGERIMPPGRLGLTLDIVQATAEACGKTVEDALAGWDPDPRICSREYRSLEDALMDLDEQERYAAVRIAHSLRCVSKEILTRDPSMERELWSIAHDRAIVECDAARTSAECRANTHGK